MIKRPLTTLLERYFGSGPDISVRNHHLKDVDPGNEIADVQILMGTRRGVYLCHASKLLLLLAGHTYGMSEFNGRWFVHQRGKYADRIVSFRLNVDVAEDCRLEIEGLPIGCHQIDFIGDSLIVADTYNNRLFVYVFDNNRLKRVREVFPRGRLARGRASDNYAHLNSVWSDSKAVYILLHNETQKTGRKSVILDKNLKELDSIVTNCANAHNVVRLNGKFFICNSMQGALSVDQKDVFQTDMLTKGLAVTEEHIFVGCSEFAKREDRDQKGGAVYVLTHKFEQVFRFTVPASVSEVRIANRPDFARSNHTRDFEIVGN